MYNKQTKQFFKENMLVRWMEDMAPEEALLMINIKDQTLDTVYPTLDIDVFIAAMGWSKEDYSKLKASSKDL